MQRNCHTETWETDLRRVEYDVDRGQRAVESQVLPSETGDRLETGW
ncbi:hypothetical protein SAMN05216218_11265 [Halorientalis regularis]|uniref:Uncharacterized protein n=1 Tax=Halorientalis regularis TaxID=660518 RepID=A0A1G7QCN0_9EURY|nr:hypothetical protein SAMN05216218_11265 [Halorientalis regularis]